MVDLPRVGTLPPRVSYVLALVATVAALWLRWVVDSQLGDQFPYSTVFLAVLLTARYGGFGPSIAAALLGGTLATFFFVPPREHFDPISPESVPAIAIFGFVTTVTIYFGRAMHRLRDHAMAAAARAEAHGRQLEEEIRVRRRAEEALKDADRRKDEFLAMLAHELRNPLAPIRNALAILNAPNLTAEQSVRARGMMGRQIEHIVRLVDDLLDLSRILRGRVELRRQPMDLAEAIHRAVEMAQPTIDAARHQLQVSLPPAPVRVDGDLVRLAQVVSNLLTNSAKYTEPKGRIDLVVEVAGPQARITVRDTGHGIAPSLLPRIFELFVQGDRSSARTQGGLGIGLTLVKQLVELHGGTVAVTSHGEGEGTTFTITLPIVKPGESGPEPTRSVRTGEQVAAEVRVLVVDDNSDAAESLACVLRQSGYEVRTAYTGPEALKTAPSFQPHAVMLDIGLPGMDGHEVARRLRTEPTSAKTMLVAITGYGQESDRRQSTEAGFDRHLVKPVDPDEIHRLLETLQTQDRP